MTLCAPPPWLFMKQEDWLEVSQADLDMMLHDYRRAEVRENRLSRQSRVAVSLLGTSHVCVCFALSEGRRFPNTLGPMLRSAQVLVHHSPAFDYIM